MLIRLQDRSRILVELWQETIISATQRCMGLYN
jgi:hypothetical protein